MIRFRLAENVNGAVRDLPIWEASSVTLPRIGEKIVVDRTIRKVVMVLWRNEINGEVIDLLPVVIVE